MSYLRELKTSKNAERAPLWEKKKKKRPALLSLGTAADSAIRASERPKSRRPASPPRPGSARVPLSDKSLPPALSQDWQLRLQQPGPPRAYCWHRPLQTTRPQTLAFRRGRGVEEGTPTPAGQSRPSQPWRRRSKAGDEGFEEARPTPAASAATLTCRRPRAWAAALAAAAASLVVVALARRLRPPPPRSLSLAPPPGLMRDPRFLLRKPRPGNGALGPPKTRHSSPAAAVCPHLGGWGVPGPFGKDYPGRELLRGGAKGGATTACDPGRQR
jgi:hypothetical protein